MLENNVEHQINRYYGLLVSAKTDKSRRRYLNKMRWWINKRSPEQIKAMELKVFKRSLPHGQLRNSARKERETPLGSLPHGQLRKKRPRWNWKS